MMQEEFQLSEHDKRVRDRWQKEMEENAHIVDELCGNLNEYSGQLVSCWGELFCFECFEHDGILLGPTIHSTRWLYVAKWFLHQIKIL